MTLPHEIKKKIIRKKALRMSIFLLVILLLVIIIALWGNKIFPLSEDLVTLKYACVTSRSRFRSFSLRRHTLFSPIPITPEK